MVFGCNLLRRKWRSARKKADGGCPLANTYTFLATPLNGDAKAPSQLQRAGSQENMATMTTAHEPIHLDTSQSFHLAVDSMEQAVSPSLTIDSERSSGMDQSSRAGSFSLPRIEDSLAEIDQLEEELEAVRTITQAEQSGPSDRRQSQPILKAPTDVKKEKSAKRVTIALDQPATVRVKPSEKIRPALRRSSSLTLRGKASEDKVLVEEQKPLRGVAIQTRTAASARSSATKPTVSSTKPLTVPKFELPGEAVARRLKEQREARRAQQAEAQKANIAPAKPKSTAPKPAAAKPLTKPTFELPGEAISRRKREEREARLKAEEEEERKKREFKARPARQSIVPSAAVRETATSRARQGKTNVSEDASKARTDTVRSKRSSTYLRGALTGISSPAKSSESRGRNPIIITSDEAIRADSTSTGSINGKKSLSTEDSSQQRWRGKEVYTQDSSYKLNREREKKEREEATKLARLQAAERSRAASREWAEKKRRKELALRRVSQSVDQYTPES